MDTEAFYTKQLAKILVIEDLPSWQKRFRRFLQEEPFKVVLATNGMDALRLAKVYTFDLLILDINLSGVPFNMDGLRIADKIWHENTNLKIIIVSGDQDWDKRLNTFDFVPQFTLEKQSLDQDDFVKKIYQALDD